MSNRGTDQKPLVSVVIVNWNGLVWLPGCISSLDKQTYENIEIILVDNASTDDSVKWVREHYPKAKIIINNKNFGFSHANNIGYHSARGKYVLFLNNDTRSTASMVEELVHVLESDPTIGGAQSKILLMDKPDTLDSIGAFLTPSGFLYHYKFMKKDLPEYDKQIDLYTAKGACMMFKRSVLKIVEVDGNIFDPDYFAYFEETDLCHRIWLAGYRIVYAPKSVVFHKMGATSSSLKSSFVQYHSFKNRINSYLKNLGFFWLLRLVPLHLVLCLGFAMVSFIRGNRGLAAAVVKAVAWNILHLRETIRVRVYVNSRIRKKRDSEIFSHILRRVYLRYYMSLMTDLSSYDG